jgi:hypothetical protein
MFGVQGTGHPATIANRARRKRKMRLRCDFTPEIQG